MDTQAERGCTRFYLSEDSRPKILQVPWKLLAPSVGSACGSAIGHVHGPKRVFETCAFALGRSANPLYQFIQLDTHRERNPDFMVLSCRDCHMKNPPVLNDTIHGAQVPFERLVGLLMFPFLTMNQTRKQSLVCSSDGQSCWNLSM